MIELDEAKVGDPVRTLDTVRPPRFAGRLGWIAALNIRDGELGVVFGQPWTPEGRPAAEAWFRPRELDRRPS